MLLDAGWTSSAASKDSVTTQQPAPDERPEGELAEASLIVRYVTEDAAKSVSAAQRLQSLGASATGIGFGKDQVIKPDPGVDPVALRAALLKEGDVEAVFFNYSYRPK